ncbi:MAG: FAD-dependent oxidoreductase [Bacteroidetes bacterium]|nr:FAD-dependent oxidoreductase [Bacteroidota bacterium]
MAQKKVAVVGGGIAGMEVASQLDYLGHSVVLLEKEKELGGHVRDWFQLFPDRRPGSEVLDHLKTKMQNSKVAVKTSAEIIDIDLKAKRIGLLDHQSGMYEVDAIVLASGFDLFDARLKEEYGYGIYKNVITSVELEEIFKSDNHLNPLGKTPKRIGFVHCVGSRDEKCNNNHCSKVCCVTAVKQAIELRMLYPEAEIICYYMDMRMFGLNYEEMYRESQEAYGIKYIRGRVSEAAENIDSSIQIKVEDTLSGRPLKMNVDLLVLLIGMLPSKGTNNLGEKLGLNFEKNGFIMGKDSHFQSNLTNEDGIFIAGTSGGPMNISDTISHARAAALEVDQFLKHKN